jgi:hypothetical protein
MPANSDITAHYNAVTANQSPTSEIEKLIAHFQHEGFFHLAIAQERRRQVLRARLSTEFSGRVFMTRKTLGRAEVVLPGIDVRYVEDGALGELQADGAFEDSILIANNNDVVQNGALDTYLNLFQNSPHTIFVAWDFDNHHWYPMSTFLAAHSDMYFPAHPDYFSLLSRYNRCIAGPVSCGVIQWSRSYLAENFDKIIFASRSDKPLGAHILYEKFRFRSQTISTLGGHFPTTVGFRTAAFHQTSAADRLKEWCGHKAHWTIPVLNDISMRLFDALTTGGVPIVPDTQKYHPTVAALAEHIVFFRATDLVSPQSVVDAANQKFDAGGVGKIIERNRLGQTQHHVSSRIETILKNVFDEFSIPQTVTNA